MRARRTLLATAAAALLASAAACASAPPPPPDWLRFTTRLDGVTTFVRLHEAIRDRAGDPEFPHRVAIVATYSKPPAHPLPTRAQKATLARLEEAILAELGESDNDLLAAILTGGGARRFVFYTARPDAYEAVVARLRQRVPGIPLSLQRAEDPGWSLYRRLREARGTAGR